MARQTASKVCVRRDIMGLLKDPAATVRPQPVSSSSAPTVSHVHHKRHLPRRIIVKAVGAVIIVSLLGMATAAQTSPGDTNKNSSSTTNHNSSIELQMDPSPNTQSSVSTNTSVSNDTSGGAPQSSVDVTVNGQHVNVPKNGTTQQTVTNSDGSATTYSVSNNDSTDGSATNFSSTTVNSNVMSNTFTNSTNINNDWGSSP